MKLLVDEQLPQLLAEVLQSKGFDAVHISALLTGERITDSSIIQISIDQNRVVITKDVDFLNNYIVRKAPPKLVYVTTGNIKNRDLLDLSRRVVQTLVEQLNEHDVIELNRLALRILY